GMPEHFAATLIEHLKWLEQLEADDALVLSGPIDLDTGLGPGLSIIRASTREQVEAMSSSEPFARAGYRTNAIRSWTVNEGSLNVRVRLMANKIVV
ncbi:MAG: YciI family protein, partial [Ilumatobacter sp.]|nr:YciI family protein [Ilumatobacter sp.]